MRGHLTQVRWAETTMLAGSSCSAVHWQDLTYA